MSLDIDTMTDAMPAPGSPVTLLSQSNGVWHEAVVRSWDSGDAGLVVSTRVELDPEAVHDLADQRVWVSVGSPDRGTTVFGGIAHPAGERSLDITGVVPLVREQRRAAVRSAAKASVTVSAQQRAPIRLAALDLSRGGVRVALRDRRELALGEGVVVDVHLDDGRTVQATGHVTRVDLRSGHAVVRFDRMDPHHGDRIDRYVLFRLTSPPHGPVES